VIDEPFDGGAVHERFALTAPLDAVKSVGVPGTPVALTAYATSVDVTEDTAALAAVLRTMTR